MIQSRCTSVISTQSLSTLQDFQEYRFRAAWTKKDFQSDYSSSETAFKEKNIIAQHTALKKTRELKRSTIAEEYSNKNTADTNKSAGAQ